MTTDSDAVRSPDQVRTWLHRIVADLVGHRVEEIDTGTQFARLGLDSLRATQLITILSRKWDRPVPTAALWAHPTIDALTEHLMSPVAKPVAASAAAQVDEPIAVVGMACRFPGAENSGELWDMLRAGVDAVRTVPTDRWDAADYADRWPETAMATDQAGFLDQPIDGFDPLFFEISPREAPEIDPQQRLFLEVAWEALEDAGIDGRALEGSRTGVFAGAIWHDYSDLAHAGLARMTSHSATGRAVNMIANRLSYVLGLRGPSVVVDTACSASLFAIHTACQSLWLNESTMAIAGGVNLLLDPTTSVGLTRFGGLSPDGRCKSFDAAADGYGRGEGCGVVVLKRLSRALADGDDVWCVIAGSAANNDGLSNGLTAPNPVAQEEVLRDAYARAGVLPADVHYVETHGTGTQLGDPIEASALGAVLGAGRSADSPLVIGSVKTNLGHLEGAAGVAGFIKAALCLRHGEIPPNLHFHNPNPHIDFAELGLRVPVERELWPEGRAALAGVSSFGWGGTNVHVVLRGVPRSTPLPRPEPTVVDARPSVAFVFSPHGQQWTGMARSLYRDEPVFRAAVRDCDAALRPHLGWSVVDRLFTADDGRVDAVDVAQPMSFAVQIGLAAWLGTVGVRPAAVVGACFSEITAAVVSGMLDLTDGARLVHLYSRAQAAVAGGGMLVAEQTPVELAEFTGSGLVVAAEYGPRSTALAGDVDALRAVRAELRARGVLCGMVRIDVAVHSPALEPALPDFRARGADVTARPGRVPMMSAVTAEPVDWRALGVDYFADGLRRPVRLADAAARLAGQHDILLEVGAHPVLASALRQVTKAVGRGRVITTMCRGDDDRAGLVSALAELADLGTGDAREPAAELVTLSARTPGALRALAGRVGAGLSPTADLADIADAAARRTEQPYRLATVACSAAEVAETLAGYSRGEDPSAVHVPDAAALTRPKTVFVFPGQGPQWVGMGRELLRTEPAFHDAIREIDAAIADQAGWSVVAELAAAEDESRLDRIDVVQPTLFAMAVALAALWRSWGTVPDAVVGHSMGEVAAAHVAGVLSLEDAVRVICGRSALLRRVSGQGAMLACELPLDEAHSVVDGREHAVSVAVNNSPRATVLSGDPGALAEIAADLDLLGVFHRWVKVDVASHSPQMDPLRADLFDLLADLKPRQAEVPLHSTVTGRVMAGPDMDAAYWVSNLREPVLFADRVAGLIDEGAAAFVEMSPHPVLLPAIGQVAGDVTAVASLRRHEPERETMLDSLARLWVLGSPTTDRVRTPGRRGLRLPAYPWQRERYWLDHLDTSPGQRTRGAGDPVPGDRLESFAEQATPGRQARPAVVTETESSRETLAALDNPVERRAAAERMVLECVAGVARVDVARIDLDSPLRSLGIDSIMSLELRDRLEKRFATRLSATVIWNYPTTRELAPFLLERIGVPLHQAGAVAAPGPAAADAGDLASAEQLDRELADLYRRLETISHDR
ncbi:hypothetical protein ALI144C_05300 [Actinosynnema sp. ALI-1.44]|nr:hypothetical protein ALI144C_05300 [Actinosynnema sp. ALI-1.44]